MARDILQFPIPQRNGNNTDKIVKLVDAVLDANNKDGNADTKRLERQIDEAVYALYDLTPEEIKIVERNSTE